MQELCRRRPMAMEHSQVECRAVGVEALRQQRLWWSAAVTQRPDGPALAGDRSNSVTDTRHLIRQPSNVQDSLAPG